MTIDPNLVLSAIIVVFGVVSTILTKYCKSFKSERNILGELLVKSQTATDKLTEFGETCVSAAKNGKLTDKELRDIVTKGSDVVTELKEEGII